MEPLNFTPFSGAQIERLKESYGSLQRIDPCTTEYNSLIKLLDNLPLAGLKQLATADIRFISVLASNRLRRQEAE